MRSGAPRRRRTQRPARTTPHTPRVSAANVRAARTVSNVAARCGPLEGGAVPSMMSKTPCTIAVWSSIIGEPALNNSTTPYPDAGHSASSAV